MRASHVLCTVLFTTPTVLWRENRDVLTWKQLFLQESTEHSRGAAAISFILSCSYSSDRKENKTEDDKKPSSHWQSREHNHSTRQKKSSKSLSTEDVVFSSCFYRKIKIHILKRKRFKSGSRKYLSLIIWNGKSIKVLGICFFIHTFWRVCLHVYTLMQYT